MGPNMTQKSQFPRNLSLLGRGSRRGYRLIQVEKRNSKGQSAPINFGQTLWNNITRLLRVWFQFFQSISDPASCRTLTLSILLFGLKTTGRQPPEIKPIVWFRNNLACPVLIRFEMWNWKDIPFPTQIHRLLPATRCGFAGIGC